MNVAMQIEREQTLNAESHQRTADGQGYADGLKPKTVHRRAGEVPLRIPQTRDYHDERRRPFYPKGLERGVRSERALTLAVAEMYVQGVGVLSEISDEWETQRSYLNMKARRPAPENCVLQKRVYIIIGATTVQLPYPARQSWLSIRRCSYAARAKALNGGKSRGFRSPIYLRQSQSDRVN